MTSEDSEFPEHSELDGDLERQASAISGTIGPTATIGTSEDGTAEGDEVDDDESAPPKKKFSALRETLLIFGVGVLCAILLQTFLVRAYSIPSPSMVPTLLEGDRVLVNKRAYGDGKIPPRGDIVVFARPDVPNCQFSASAPDVLIKRVIGRPGEHIYGKDGRIYVNGKLLDEPWFPTPPVSKAFSPISVGDGQILVLGDNRLKSQDGSCFGPIAVDTVVGHAFHRIWPLGRFGDI